MVCNVHKQKCIQETSLQFQNAVYYLFRSKEGNSEQMIISGMKFSSVVFLSTCKKMNEYGDGVAVRFRGICKVLVRISVALTNILNKVSLSVLNVALQ
jgi:hypothetical protein